MNKTKHTPGPWRYEKQLAGNNYDIYSKDFWIGSSHDSHDKSSGFPPDEEALPNAQLIAAAPDLLEACREMFIYIRDLGKLDTLNEQHAKWIETIAKAEGRD